jgi:serine protease
MKRFKTLWRLATVIGLVMPFGERLAAMEPNPSSPRAAAPGASSDGARAQASSPTARIIVKYRDNAQARMATPESAAASAQALSQRAGVSLRHLRVMGNNAQVLTLDAPRSEEEVRAIAERIAQDPAVEYAEPDAPMRIQQNDPRRR